MELIIKIKTGIQLAKDYMYEKGADISEYKQKLEEIELAVKEQLSILLLHRANIAIETDKCGICRTKKLYNDYNDIEIDHQLYEEFKDLSFTSY